VTSIEWRRDGELANVTYERTAKAPPPETDRMPSQRSLLI
jgi:hypothetical protein